LYEDLNGMLGFEVGELMLQDLPEVIGIAGDNGSRKQYQRAMELVAKRRN
jgi:hypothetical protein